MKKLGMALTVCLKTEKNSDFSDTPYWHYVAIKFQSLMMEETNETLHLKIELSNECILTSWYSLVVFKWHLSSDHDAVPHLYCHSASYPVKN